MMRELFNDHTRKECHDLSYSMKGCSLAICVLNGRRVLGNAHDVIEGEDIDGKNRDRQRPYNGKSNTG